MKSFALNTRRFFSFTQYCVGAMLLLAPVPSGAQPVPAYPSKPVRLVVPFPPGGSTDIVARVISRQLSEMWGQQFVIDNRPGAGGALGAETVARAAPDGYTVMLTNPGPSVHNVVLRKKPTYGLNDFAPVVYIGYAPLILVANPKVPAKTSADLVSYARANPGKINWASPGNGSNPHIALELLKAATRIDVVHIPYKGAGPALTEVVAGQVDVLYASLISADSHIKAGRLKVLGVGGAKRQPALPDVPTFAEQGIKVADANLWIGLVTGAKVPRAIVEKLNAGVNKSLQQPDVRQRFEQLGVEVEGGTPEKFGRFMKQEMDTVGALVKSGALQVE